MKIVGVTGGSGTGKTAVCREFEKLPIIKYTDILRNILYSGVWCRFEAVSGKRKKEQEKENV